MAQPAFGAIASPLRWPHLAFDGGLAETAHPIDRRIAASSIRKRNSDFVERLAAVTLD
jgi:hypothetical protein